MAETRRYIAAIGNPIGGGGPITYSAEAAQYFARLDTDPITSQKNLLAALIDGLVTDSAWTPIDVLKVYANDTQNNAFVNLRKSGHVSTLTNTVGFVAYRGFTGGGAGSDEVDEHYVPLTSAVGLTPTSVTMGAWCLTSHTASTVLGCDASVLNIYPNYAGDAYFRIQDAAPAGSAGASDGIGLFLGTRSNGTTSRAFKNKVEMANSPISSTNEATLLGSGLKACNGATGQVAAIIIGGDMAAVQDKIYDRLYTYLHAVGAV
jgi:hypothetical protein